MPEAHSLVSRCISEFVGTYVLVFTIGCNVMPTVLQPGIGGSPYGVLSIAFALAVMVYVFGPISGGHFNPAVTLAVKLVDPVFSFNDLLYYWVFQVLGSIVAGLSYAALFGAAFNVAPQIGFGWVEAGGIELLYTFMLAFVVLNTACAERSANTEFFGLSIGMVVAAGAYAGGWISGGCFNPAVAIGADLVSAKQGFGWSLAYSAFEMVGAVIAAMAYSHVRSNEDQPSISAKLTAEFIGTFFLVLTVGLCVLGHAGPAGAFGIAMCLLSMVYATGTVSGGHLNPAVTLAILAAGRGKISGSDALSYIFIQILAGIVGGLVYSGITKLAFPVAPVGGHHLSQALVGEAIFTYVLCLTVLTVATIDRSLKHFFGLAIGACVIVGGYAIGSTSGGHLNPAVSFGIDTAAAARGGKWVNCVIWSLAQAAGGLLAAGTFRTTHTDEFGARKIPLHMQG